MKRTLVGLFRSFEQTGEKSKDPALKTKYYRISKDKAWTEVISVLNKMRGYKVVHEVKNVGEILVEKRTVFGRKQDVTVMLFAVSPIKSAIDIYSASRGSLGDLGSNYRTILEIYSAVDKRLGEYKVSE